jgi:hypothetical protein
MIDVHLAEWLREALGDKVSQLIGMFNDLERYVREEAITTFGQLAQHGEQHNVGKYGQSLMKVVEILRSAIKDSASLVVDMLKHSNTYARRASVMAIKQLAQHSQLPLSPLR